MLDPTIGSLVTDADAVPTRTVTSRHGVKISYAVLGDGPRTLLLANGLGGRLYAWEPLIRALPKGYKVITWDYRGLFDSESPSLRRHLSVPDHAEDAVAILDAEGISNAVLCGWSMGVQVSLEVSTLHPDRVLGLVLLNGTYGHAFASGLQPFFRIPFASSWGHAMVEYLVDSPRVTSAIATAAPHLTPLALGVFKLIASTPTSQLRPMIERYAREVFEPRTFRNYLRLFQELDAHSAIHHLRDIQAPTLIVSGALDALTPAYQSVVMARRIPNAEAIHLLNASHFVLMERSEVVIPAILKFLEQRVSWT